MSVKEQRKKRTKRNSKDTFHKGNRNSQKVNQLINDYYNRVQ